RSTDCNANLTRNPPPGPAPTARSTHPAQADSPDRAASAQERSVVLIPSARPGSLQRAARRRSSTARARLSSAAWRTRRSGTPSWRGRTVFGSAPYRPNGVDDPAGREASGGRRHGLSDRQASTVPAGSQSAALVQDRGPALAVDRAVHPPPPSSDEFATLTIASTDSA